MMKVVFLLNNIKYTLKSYKVYTIDLKKKMFNHL